MNNEKFKYDFLEYNKYLVLKPNLSLKIILFFLCKETLFVVFFLAFSFRGDDSSIMKHLLEPSLMLSNIPALIVLITIFYRKPGAGQMVKNLWKYGRELLFLSSLLGLAVIFQKVGFSLENYSFLAVFFILGYSAAFVYLLFSEQTRDLFREFPD